MTSGNSDVVRILAHKQETRTIYYLGTSPSNSMQRHLYSIPDVHSSMPRMPTCLTCNQNGDEQPLEHHVHRPRHSFLSSEYLDSDPILRQPRPGLNALDDVPMFAAAAVTENEDGRPGEAGELMKEAQPGKEPSVQHATQRNCSFFDATFSTFSDYYVLQCLGPDVPFAEIRTVDGNQIGKHEYRL